MINKSLSIFSALILGLMLMTGCTDTARIQIHGTIVVDTTKQSIPSGRIADVCLEKMKTENEANSNETSYRLTYSCQPLVSDATGNYWLIFMMDIGEAQKLTHKAYLRLTYPQNDLNKKVWYRWYPLNVTNVDELGTLANRSNNMMALSISVEANGVIPAWEFGL